MEHDSLPHRPGFISHAELEFVDTGRRVQRTHAVEDSPDAWPSNQGLRDHETEGIVDVLCEKIPMALLVQHVTPAIHLKNHQRLYQPLVHFRCKHLKAIDAGST